MLTENNFLLTSAQHFDFMLMLSGKFEFHSIKFSHLPKKDKI